MRWQEQYQGAAVQYGQGICAGALWPKQEQSGDPWVSSLHKTRLPGAVTSHTPGFPSHMLAAAVRRAAQSLPARFALCKHTAMPSPLDLLGYRVIGL